MRKLIVSALAVAVTAGFSLAGEGLFVSYDKDSKTLKVKDGGAEKTYKVTDKTAFKNGDKDIKKEGAGLERLGKLKADAKFDLSADKDDVTEIKFAAGKKDKSKADK